MKKLGCIICALVMLVSLGACSPATVKDVVVKTSDLLLTVPEMPELYQNTFLEDRLPDQWAEYGLGDPYIYRFDGRYYLICSTKATEKGVKGWTSTDLYHWEEVDNGVDPVGYVVGPDVAESFDAWASEVYYLDGYFYLVESSNGKGHYVLRSQSPIGPFEVISSRLDESRIDGSLYMDTDGKMVLLFAASGGISAKTMNDAMTDADTPILLPNTSMEGWTEGPEVFTKNGTRYYFYTGNGVTQWSYRVDYSYQDASESIMSGNNITQGHNVVLNTDPDWYGLGHCTVVMGPDLDSVYMGYHNSYMEGNSGGRRFNLSRLLMNGNEIVMQHNGLYDNIMPRLPDYRNFNSANLSTDGPFLLSSEQTEDSFTVEYNVTGNGKMVFSYKDASNYGYMSFDGTTVSIRKVTNGSDVLVGEADAYRPLSTDVQHTFMISYKNGTANISIDQQEVAAHVEVGEFGGGKVGYSDTYSYKGCLTFNNSAQGDGDKLTLKQENIPANSYTDSLSEFSAKDPLQNTDSELDGEYVQGTKDIVLSSPMDYATYEIFAAESGSYGLDMVVPSTSFGKTVGIQVDGGKIYKWNIGSTDMAGYARVKVADIKLERGAHNLTVVALDENVTFNMMHLERNFNVEGYVYEQDLLTYPQSGINYPTFFNKDKDGFYSDTSARYLVTFGNGGLEDVQVDLDVSLYGENGTGTCGIVIAADNFAFTNLDLDNYKSMQGYYFMVNNNKAEIMVGNYQYTDESCRDIYFMDMDVTYHLTAVKQGKQLSFYINGELILQTTSNLGRTRGYVGIYSNFINARFNNLKITVL